jgi:hypothetical protein
MTNSDKNGPKTTNTSQSTDSRVDHYLKASAPKESRVATRLEPLLCKSPYGPGQLPTFAPGLWPFATAVSASQCRSLGCSKLTFWLVDLLILVGSIEMSPCIDDPTEPGRTSILT